VLEIIAGYSEADRGNGISIV